MKIGLNPAAKHYCRRFYNKARARGFNMEQINSYLLTTYSAGSCGDLEYEDYKSTVAWLNTLPFIDGHGPIQAKPVESPPQARKKKKYVRRGLKVRA